MNVEFTELENKIKEMKQSLIQIVCETGFNSNETLEYSQKLDDFITKHQKLQLNNYLDSL